MERVQTWTSKFVDWKRNILPSIIEGYKTEDIFNCD